MKLTVMEIVRSLQCGNGLQHLGQIAGFHLMVDEDGGTFWEYKMRGGVIRGQRTYPTSEGAWFDWLMTNLTLPTLQALMVLAQQGLKIHPSMVEVIGRHLLVDDLCQEIDVVETML